MGQKLWVVGKRPKIVQGCAGLGSDITKSPFGLDEFQDAGAGETGDGRGRVDVEVRCRALLRNPGLLAAETNAQLLAARQWSEQLPSEGIHILM